MAKVRDCPGAYAWTKRLDSTFDHIFSSTRCSVLVFGCWFRKPTRSTPIIRASSNHFSTGFSPPYPISVTGGVKASTPPPYFHSVLFYSWFFLHTRHFVQLALLAGKWIKALDCEWRLLRSARHSSELPSADPSCRLRRQFLKRPKKYGRSSWFIHSSFLVYYLSTSFLFQSPPASASAWPVPFPARSLGRKSETTKAGTALVRGQAAALLVVARVVA